MVNSKKLQSPMDNENNVHDSKANERKRPFGAFRKICVVGIIGAVVSLSGCSSQDELDRTLSWAAQDGNIKLVQKALDDGANVNSQTTFDSKFSELLCQKSYLGDHFCYGTPLISAVLSKKGGLVNFLINKGADPRLHSETNLTPLATAAIMGDAQNLKILLKRGASLNGTCLSTGTYDDPQLLTAFTSAARTGNVEILDLLLHHDAQVNEHSCSGRTALMEAAQAGKTDAVKFLLQKGADINLKSPKEDTAISLAASAGNIDIVGLLIEKEAAFSTSELLDTAIEKDNSALADFLFKKFGLNSFAEKSGQIMKWALFHDHPQVVEKLKERGLDSVGDSYWDVMKWAISNGNTEIVKKLIAQGAGVNSKDQDGDTALMLALDSKRKEMVRLVLDAGADPNERDGKGRAPLDRLPELPQDPSWIYNAFPNSGLSVKEKSEMVRSRMDARTHMAKERLEMAKSLLDAGAHIELMKYRQSVFCSMIEEGEADLAKLIINSGLNAEDGAAGLVAAASNGRKEIASILLDNGVNVNSTGPRGNTPLVAASFNKQTEMVKLLLDKRANINSTGAGGETALMAASRLAQVEMIKFLLANGADPSIKDENGKNALDQAVGSASRSHNLMTETELEERGQSIRLLFESGAFSPNASLFVHLLENGECKSAKIFLERGLDINSRDEEGRSILLQVLSWENDFIGPSDEVKLLVDNGADVNIPDKEGVTPLMHACKKDGYHLALFLLDKKANANALDVDGNSALDFATQHSGSRYTVKDVSLELVKLLLDRGASTYDPTPLFDSVQYGNPKTVQLLLERGVDPNAKDKSGKTPLQYAKEGNNAEIVKILEKHNAK